jgi:tetratricopeptide (TPR) repeat protein
MVRLTQLLALTALAACASPVYEVRGHFSPEARASVALAAVNGPFVAEVLSDENGRFSFNKISAGTYTITIDIPVQGEAHATVEVGPGTADSEGRVALMLRFQPSDFEAGSARRRASVSAGELAIPEKALHEYAQARGDLAKPDAEAARLHLERAVEIAPRFAAAWNELGTLAYKERHLERAEECFRAALAAEPDAFEPLVNLGGVLIQLGKFDEAIDRNVHAVLARPNDALANSQLGLTYFSLGRYDLARKYLETARRLDPSHFSQPQLTLAEIDLREGHKRAAADELQDFLDHHPDYPQAAKVREKIAEWRQ